MNKWQKKFPLGQLTRFGVGGLARHFITVTREKKLLQLMPGLKQFIIIGAGTNLLVSDGDIRSPVIQIQLKGISTIGRQQLEVASGTDLNYLVNYCNRSGLAGLENMAGIPGTVGGAIVGHAGAYGQEISECLTAVKIWDGSTIKWLSANTCGFDYRTSIFKTKRDYVVLAARFGFKNKQSPGSLQKISASIRRLRRIKYPSNIKCPGSYFKNIIIASLPTGSRARLTATFSDFIKGGKIPAAVLLDAVGLKGRQRGQIKVADYHANLIMNLGKGRARDVQAIASHAQKMVYKKFGLWLEEEVRILDN